MDTATRQIRYLFETPPAPGEATEIADGILWMRLPLPMALDHVNVYAIDEGDGDGDGWSIVDTGFDSRKTRAIWQSLFDGPLAGKPVRRLIVTHHHPDHIGLAGWFVERGAELVTTRTAWLMARMLTLDVEPEPKPETVAYWKSAGMAPDVLERRMTERPFNFADCVAPLPLGYTRIKDGDRIALGGRDWSVVTGNGHAAEHATLWSDDGDFVIAGDQLLPSISPNLGVYASEPEADPVGEWLESCETFARRATGTETVLPGHKLPYRGLPTRIDQLVENHRGALDRLEAHLSEPRAAGECFMPLFKREISGGEYGLALVEAMAHCLHLWHSGRATRTRRDDGAWLWQAKET